MGRLSRLRAEYVRAEAWYQRALVLAARSGDKETQARSYGGLANIHSQRGNYPLAMELTKTMARLARRHGLHDEKAGATYGLAVLNFEAGDIAEGMRLARAALGLLDSSDQRVCSVVHDMAVALMHSRAALPPFIRLTARGSQRCARSKWLR